MARIFFTPKITRTLVTALGTAVVIGVYGWLSYDFIYYSELNASETAGAHTIASVRQWAWRPDCSRTSISWKP